MPALYNRSREYAPPLGRYAQSDPIGQLSDLNLFVYARSNPLSLVDPLGLASCSYSINSHTLICVSEGGNTAQIGPEGVFSGNGECANNPACEDEADRGPVPPGEYAMEPASKYGGSYWLREGVPTRALCKLGLARCEFFLHLGTRSNGCVTVDPDLSDDFNAVRDVLSDSEPDILTVVP